MKPGTNTIKESYVSDLYQENERLDPASAVLITASQISQRSGVNLWSFTLHDISMSW